MNPAQLIIALGSACGLVSFVYIILLDLRLSELEDKIKELEDNAKAER